MPSDVRKACTLRSIRPNASQGVTVPGVAVASFLYLGFIAAGEEIEQPFGYGKRQAFPKFWH